jgi:cold shock CspA family protein
MPIPLRITCSGVVAGQALRSRIHREAEKLDRFARQILACRVIVTGASHRHHQGNLYAVRLQISIPHGQDIVVDRNPDSDHAHEDPYVAVRDAFNAARRRLQDRERRLEGKVKTHERLRSGQVVRVNARGYGFIETSDGQEVYFHHNALGKEKLDQSMVGARVRFRETETDGRVQASMVRRAR